MNFLQHMVKVSRAEGHVIFLVSNEYDEVAGIVQGILRAPRKGLNLVQSQNLWDE